MHRVFIGLAATAIVALAWIASRDRPAAGPCDLPPRDCTEDCDDLVRFSPARGRGYVDVPLSDEVTANLSTSYVRRDLMMAVKHATAKVACLATDWPGNGGVLALGDMSDRDGATPGTIRDRPRHPTNTHIGGRDIDLAYFQRNTPDNNLRAVCRHHLHGVDQRHCLGPPKYLDAKRTALLIGTLLDSPSVRVVGVDGATGPAITRELATLCAAGLVGCDHTRLVYETVDTGRGWYQAHHNHLHVSWRRD